MTSIMGLIGQVRLELFALDTAIFTLHSIIHKTWSKICIESLESANIVNFENLVA